MKINLLNYLVCPICHSTFVPSIHKKTKERVLEGELKCKACDKKFHIKNGVVCFVSYRKPTKKAIQKLRKITLVQEIPKKWMRLFLKKEIISLQKEWNWMSSIIKKGKGTTHLDFATGTGRFLRSIISKTKGEIIALERDYLTCLELLYFLKKIKRYNRVSIVCANASEMPFKNGVFNNVSAWAGLGEPKMEKAIKESRRILKNGGWLATSGIHYQKGSKSFLRAEKHKIYFSTKEAIIRALKDAGFRKMEHKIFFEGKWSGKGDYLPIFGDLYSTYAIKAKK